MRERLAEVAAALEAAIDDLDEIIAEPNNASDRKLGELQTVSWLLHELTERIAKQPSS